MGEIRNAYKILVSKPGRKGPVGRPRRRCDVNTYKGELWCKDLDWIHPAQDRVQWRGCERGNELSFFRSRRHFLTI
jgi:hypothetical protein